jgi:HD-GYP domain-containing protein (c-di-GMP phosphodiesterase class II)
MKRPGAQGVLHAAGHDARTRLKIPSPMKGLSMQITDTRRTDSSKMITEGTRGSTWNTTELRSPTEGPATPLCLHPVDGTSVLSELVAFSGVTRALLETIEAKDPCTRGHCDRVADLSRRLAIHSGCDEQTVDEATVCGWLHDVGKIGVPDAVLQKTGRLTDAEFEAVKRHPATGERILGCLPQIETIRAGVRSHHERWDGRGYPDGLSGESIPLLGRIVAIADAFDAMRSNRTYRNERSLSDALHEIAVHAGSQFDPFLAACFLDMNFMNDEPARLPRPGTSLRKSA